MRALAPADLVVFAGAALAGAIAVARRSKLAPALAAAHSGAAWYAGLWTVAAAAADGEGWLGAGLMAAAAVGSLACAAVVWRLDRWP